MSNTITIELCAEDRARLDRLSNLLEQRIAQAATIMAMTDEPDPNQLTIDDVQQKLAETLANAEAPKTAAEETEAETPTTTQAEEEKPTVEEIAPKAEAVEPTVTLEQIQQKVVQLAAGSNGAKKAAVREIINAYAKKVSDLPEDKWPEVWGKLTTLESEVIN